MTGMEGQIPAGKSASARGAFAAALSCGVGCIVAIGYWLSTVDTHNTSVTGGEALVPVLLFVFFGASALACGAAALLGAFAGAVAARFRSALAGLLAGLGAGVAAALILLVRFVGGFALIDTLPEFAAQTLPIAAALGGPAAIGGLMAGWPRRSAPARMPRAPRVAARVQTAAAATVAAVAAVKRAAVPVADAAQHHLPADLRVPDAANALARWPLLMLLFVALTMFAVFVLLAAPDLAPWEGNDFWLAQAINAGSMPWSKAVTAWVLDSQGAADPFVAALLVGLGLGFNVALLAGLLASLRRTVPVR